MSKMAAIGLGVGVGLGFAACVAVRPVQPAFIRVRNDNSTEVKLNTKSIRWVAKYNGAYYICARQDGCVMSPYGSDKFVVDPDENPESYALLSKL